MKKENEALWREVVTLRRKHENQQKIVNKLIQFLVGMVQPRMGPTPVKRRYQAPLALETADVSGLGGSSSAKEAKMMQPTAGDIFIQDVTHEMPAVSYKKQLRMGILCMSHSLLNLSRFRHLRPPRPP